MIDRDEILRARIDNYLDEKRARLARVRDGAGVLAVRAAGENGMTVGAFASSRRAYRKGDRHYFIESTTDSNDSARQLWLPAIGRVAATNFASQREIVSTESEPSRRFAAWQEVQPLTHDTDGYSPYNPDSESLLKEAKISLEFIGANDGSFAIQIFGHEF